MEITKINYNKNYNAYKNVSFKGQEKISQETKTAQASADDALSNYNRANIALAKTGLDRYVIKSSQEEAMDHMMFYLSKRGRGLCRGVASGPWQVFPSQNTERIPWKIHVYSDNEADWQKLSRIMTRYMKQQNCAWKTLSLTSSVEDLEKKSKCQKGKAFTIYPSSSKQFAEIAHDLNYIIKESNMQLEDTEIVGDRALGDSGRIFYRYEYNSGDYKDSIFDMDNPDDEETRRRIYRSNSDGAYYLASDMGEEDDPWLNFNPNVDFEAEV